MQLPTTTLFIQAPSSFCPTLSPLRTSNRRQGCCFAIRHHLWKSKGTMVECSKREGKALNYHSWSAEPKVEHLLGLVKPRTSQPIYTELL